MASEINHLIDDCSHMASNLIPSEIIKLNNEINQKRKEGKFIYNLTIGDFDPKFFPIPELLRDEIIRCYEEGQTNYPPAQGELELRKSLQLRLQEDLHLDYDVEDILVAGGSRPLIYATYLTLLDPGDAVIYALPSWNNNHYCHLANARKIELEVGEKQNFMPTAKDITPHLSEATLLALCSPQNPTGTVFSKEVLHEICQQVLEENSRRKGLKKPLYIMFDQMYWQLTYGNTEHYHPVQLVPEVKEYTVYIDGLSKAFAGTGVRVGWSYGPTRILSKMRAILSHIGAWAPKPEQVACGRFLKNKAAIDAYMGFIKPEIEWRLNALFTGLFQLKEANYPIDIIPPLAAIYLTARFPWKGKKLNDGTILQNQNEVTSFILNQCQIAIVPFNAFGASKESDWYRISVGTLDKADVVHILSNLKKGMDQFLPEEI